MSEIRVDTISEKTSANGVSIDGVIVKDGAVDVQGVSDGIILDADGDTTLSADTDDVVHVKTGGTDRLTIQSTAGSNVVIADGLTLTDGNVTFASGHGINFAVTANSSVGANISEKLYDYEQGTWDIGLSSGTGGALTLNGTYDLGTYQLINDICYIKGYVVVTGFPNSNSGNITLTGLPFPVQNNAGYFSPLLVGYVAGLNIASGKNLGGFFNINTSTAKVSLQDAADGMSHLQASELTDSGSFMFFGSYTIG